MLKHQNYQKKKRFTKRFTWLWIFFVPTFLACYTTLPFFIYSSFDIPAKEKKAKLLKQIKIFYNAIYKVKQALGTGEEI